ncbi:MAG: hypothetical protein JXJ17_01245 [Anaerolineae bacterium]|nr:hypothetical protein [Anaerolineae bacterium]
MSDFDPFGDFAADQPATLEEVKSVGPTRSPRERNLIYNTISLFFLAATVGCCIVTVLLIRNPTLAINPFPPATPQPTPTLFSLESVQVLGEIDMPKMSPTPEETPTPEIAVEPTNTPPIAFPTDEPSATQTPALTATGAIAPLEATLTQTGFPFDLQASVAYMSHLGAEGCNYMAIAGQVFDGDGDPLLGVPVVAEGGDLFSALDFTGNATQYGPAGYEIYIDASPYAGTFTVKLVSETGMALSDNVVVETSDSCSENIAIVNFVQVGPD